VIVMSPYQVNFHGRISVRDVNRLSCKVKLNTY